MEEGGWFATVAPHFSELEAGYQASCNLRLINDMVASTPGGPL
jgi:hypothetical protein